MECTAPRAHTAESAKRLILCTTEPVKHELFADDTLLRRTCTAQDGKWSKTTSCRAISCRAISSRAISCRAISCRAISSRAISSRAISCRAISSRAISCRAKSCREISCRAISSQQCGADRPAIVHSHHCTATHAHMQHKQADREVDEEEDLWRCPSH